MKKLLISFFVLAMALVLSGCGQRSSEETQPSSPAKTPQVEKQQPPEKDDGLFSGSIKDLFGKKDNLKCEVTYQDGQGQGKSVTYVSGDKARIDVDMLVTGGESLSSHTIIDGEWMYMWTDGQTKGTKMKLDSIEEEPAEMPEMPEIPGQTDQKMDQTKTDLNEKLDYKCSTWTPDNSFFVPPSDIEFTDFSETLQKMQQSACAFCNNIPDATAKAECLKSCQ